MLVLTRKKGEQVVIDGNITVTVIDNGAGRVRLGFQAPREIAIVRSELVASQDWEVGNRPELGLAGGLEFGDVLPVCHATPK